MLSIPDELDLLMFFETDPFESIPEDGYFCYKLVDNREVELFFSFHIIQASIQIRLMLSDCELAVFSREYAEKITIEKDKSGEYLMCIFKLDRAESKAIIFVRPEIKVHWSILAM